MQRQEILYLRGRRETQQPAQENEKIVAELLPPTWSVAFNVHTRMLTLLTEDEIVTQIHLTPSETYIFYLLYVYYPHYAPDAALWDRLQSRDLFADSRGHSSAEGGLPEPSHYHLATKENEQIIGRFISQLRTKLRPLQLTIKRMIGTGYILIREQTALS